MKSRTATYAASSLPDITRDSSVYRRLLAWPAAVREPRAFSPVFPYSERHLHCVWYDDDLRPTSLKDASGEPVIVERPGRWNLEAGPDFLAALVRVGSRMIAGDVEIHIHPRDWISHGHHNDTRYDNVRIHVTYFEAHVDRALFPPGTIHISLQTALHHKPGFSLDCVDPTAYPYSVRGPRRPCHEIIKAAPEGTADALLEAAGKERLRRKAAAFADIARERGTDQALYEEISTALGYKHNKTPFRRLARIVPRDALRHESAGDPHVAYAILAGVSGLLPKEPSPAWPPENRRFLRRVWDDWWPRASRWEHLSLPENSWRLNGLRPVNHPLRRLMALACLATNPHPLPEAVTRLYRRSPNLGRATGALFDFPENFWHHHLSLRGPRLAKPVALLGKHRLAAITVNTIVPFLIAAGEKEIPLDNLPAEEINSIMKSTAAALLGPDHNPRLYRSGIRRQGLIQIAHDFCLPGDAACSECPLPDNLRNQLKSGAFPPGN